MDDSGLLICERPAEVLSSILSSSSSKCCIKTLAWSINLAARCLDCSEDRRAARARSRQLSIWLLKRAFTTYKDAEIRPRLPSARICRLRAKIPSWVFWNSSGGRLLALAVRYVKRKNTRVVTQQGLCCRA